VFDRYLTTGSFCTGSCGCFPFIFLSFLSVYIRSSTGRMECVLAWPVCAGSGTCTAVTLCAFFSWLCFGWSASAISSASQAISSIIYTWTWVPTHGPQLVSATIALYASVCTNTSTPRNHATHHNIAQLSSPQLVWRREISNQQQTAPVILFYAPHYCTPPSRRRVQPCFASSEASHSICPQSPPLGPRLQLNPRC
jgi:hypothetical protein